MQITIPQDLHRLGSIYQDAGHEIRLVGGCVRDSVLGIPPKDLDLATTATPDEQMALARAHGLRHLELGLAHGTVGIVIPSGVYEITTLRREQDHDGRHATCTWSKDWTEDAARRDLTINAMSLDFEGRLHDPFGGYADLQSRRVRFVGDAELRLKEDYLRGLRFLRFHGRISGEAPLDPEGERALRTHASGLGKLSAERIRSEIEKVITGPHALRMMTTIADLGLATHIGLPRTSASRLEHAIAHGVSDPHDRLAAHLGYDPKGLADLATQWKVSGDVRERWAFVSTAHRDEPETAMARYKRHLAVDRVPAGRVMALALAEERPAEAAEIARWPVPKCPVNGEDLIRIGHRPGKVFGETIRAVTERWSQSDYALDRAALLRDVPRVKSAAADIGR